MDDLIQDVKDTIEAITEGVWTSDGFGAIVRKSDNKVIAEVVERDDLEFLANAGEWINLLIERLETAERQRDEAIKALEIYAEENKWGADRYGRSNIFRESDDGYELAAYTLKRIEGATQAEGHQSTESPSAAAAETGIGGSYE